MRPVVLFLLGAVLYGCLTPKVEEITDMKKTNEIFSLNGADVTEKEYLAFKGQLNISPDFIDERYPEGLGYGSIWSAIHKTSNERYRISEQVLNNVTTYSIDLQKIEDPGF